MTKSFQRLPHFFGDHFDSFCRNKPELVFQDVSKKWVNSQPNNYQYCMLKAAELTDLKTKVGYFMYTSKSYLQTKCLSTRYFLSNNN